MPLLNPDTEVYAGTLNAALARLWSEERIGMVGVKLVTETGELDQHASARSPPRFQRLPTSLGSAAAQAHPVASANTARAISVTTSRARWTRSMAPSCSARPRPARGRSARRGLLALYGGPGLVSPLLGCGLEGLLRAGGNRAPCQGRLQWHPSRIPPRGRLSPRHGSLLPPLQCSPHSALVKAAVYTGIWAKLATSIVLSAFWRVPVYSHPWTSDLRETERSNASPPGFRSISMYIMYSRIWISA